MKMQMGRKQSKQSTRGGGGGGGGEGVKTTKKITLAIIKALPS
jgi:hypothetical protein